MASTVEQFLAAVGQERVQFAVSTCESPSAGMTLQYAAGYMAGLAKAVEMITAIRDEAEGRPKPGAPPADNPYLS